MSKIADWSISATQFILNSFLWSNIDTRPAAFISIGMRLKPHKVDPHIFAIHNLEIIWWWIKKVFIQKLIFETHIILEAFLFIANS